MFSCLISVIAAISTRGNKARIEESGQGLVEYALVLVLIAIAVIVMLMLFGDTLNNTYCNIIEAISLGSTQCN